MSPQSPIFNKFRQLMLVASFLGILSGTLPGFAQSLSDHPGYLSDVESERHQITKEVVITPPVEMAQEIWVDKIFTQKMTKEFSREFRHRFGHTEFEQLSFTSNRFAETQEGGRLVPHDEYIEKQESFGQYIAKELTEYHVDSYLRGNSSTRVIYKTKEAISNVSVNTAGGYKFKFRYKLASNRVTFRLEKPGQVLHPQVDAQLDGTEATMRLAYDISKTVRLATDYVYDQEIFSLRAYKRLTSSLGTSVTAQSFAKNLPDTMKQDRILFGLSWND